MLRLTGEDSSLWMRRCRWLTRVGRPSRAFIALETLMVRILNVASYCSVTLWLWFPWSEQSQKFSVHCSVTLFIYAVLRWIYSKHRIYCNKRWCPNLQTLQLCWLSSLLWYVSFNYYSESGVRIWEDLLRFSTKVDQSRIKCRREVFSSLPPDARSPKKPFNFIHVAFRIWSMNYLGSATDTAGAVKVRWF